MARNGAAFCDGYAAVAGADPRDSEQVLAAYTAGVEGRGRWRDPVRLASSVLLLASLVYAVVIAPEGSRPVQQLILDRIA